MPLRSDTPYIPASAFDVSGHILVDIAGVCEVKRAFATGATIANHPLVAAVADKKIRVVQFYHTSASAVNVVFKSGTTTINGNIASSGVMSSYCPHGWFETTAGAALQFALDAAVSTSVHVIYVEIT